LPAAIIAVPVDARPGHLEDHVTDKASTPHVLAIFTASMAREEVTELTLGELEAGAGLQGDRYHADEGIGTFSPQAMDPDHQLTLIEAEKIDAFVEATGFSGGYGAFRRNVVTRGVDLNALVGAKFKVGSAVVRGMRLCAPCAHLAGLVDPRVLKQLVHRAGLRAEIVTSGVARPGDPIELL
jgi:MOSC domain-containing protein YiiM